MGNVNYCHAISYCSGCLRRKSREKKYKRIINFAGITGIQDDVVATKTVELLEIYEAESQNSLGISMWGGAELKIQ